MKKTILNHIKSRLDEPNEVQITKPRDNSFGHFATPLSFVLAKKLRKNPHLIATELAQKLQDDDFFESVDAIAGYINFKLSSGFLDRFATDALKYKDVFAKQDLKDKILIEYVSANPTGPLHIGHARGAVFGDTLVRVGRHLGYDITTEYYVNDAGNQIRLLGDSIEYAVKTKLLKQTLPPLEESYKGEYIDDVAKDALAFFKEDFFTNTDKEKLSSWAKDKMLSLIKSNLKMANIEFDSYVSEKEIFKEWDRVKNILQKDNALYEKDGKIYIKSANFTDDNDRVVVRDNKIPTYLAGDIVYHNNKFERNFDKYINIWGADHHGYIARVKASIEFLGYDSSKLEIILSQMVALLKGKQPYKMSKRAGNFILMSDIIDEIGIDALRFIFLTKKSDTHLEFDVDDLKKEDSSNPVFYVNYAHARICSIFRKLNINEEELVDVELVNLNDSEKELLFEALILPEILDDAFHSRNLQVITEYLYKLSSKFHKFYTENRVIGNSKEDVLLKIFAVIKLSIQTALKLLGIKAKERM